VWTVTAAGKKMPVDLDGTSHFVTCPQADQHRKRKEREPQSMAEAIGANADWPPPVGVTSPPATPAPQAAPQADVSRPPPEHTCEFTDGPECDLCGAPMGTPPPQAADAAPGGPRKLGKTVTTPTLNKLRIAFKNVGVLVTPQILSEVGGILKRSVQGLGELDEGEALYVVDAVTKRAVPQGAAR
jgi:hypothetical protein